MKAILKNTALISASAILALLLCECLVRTYVTVRNVGPSFTTYDPYFGKVIKRNFDGVRHTPEFTMRISTNSFGFRGSEEEYDQPVLFLGDSFTLGYGVDDGEEYPQLVGAALEVSVLNRGVGNAGQAHWVKFLRRDAHQFQPRLVVMQLLSNDFWDNPRERQFELSNGELEELPIQAPGMKRILQNLVENVPGASYSHLVSLGREINPNRATFGASSTNENAAAEALTRALVNESIRICAANDWPVLIIAIDIEPEFLASLDDGAEFLLLPSKSDRPDLYYRIDGHWNAAGHVDAAHKIVQVLTKSPGFTALSLAP